MRREDEKKRRREEEKKTRREEEDKKTRTITQLKRKKDFNLLF
jgi:hypothetical protein